MSGDFQAFLGRFSPKNTPASLFILFISGSDFQKCAEKLFGEGVVQNKPLLAAQQIISLGFVVYDYRSAKKKLSE